MKTQMIMVEREHSRRVLAEGEDRFQRLLEAVTDYIYTVRIQAGRAVTTTHGPGCEGVTGFTSDEFSRDPYLWYRIVHEDDRELVLRQAERILTGNGRPQPLEHRIRDKNGRIRWIRNTCIPHRSKDGRLDSYDGLIKDITAEKAAELKRIEIEDRLSLIVEGSTDGVWDWNVNTGKTFFSPRWKEMLGYEDHELANHFDTWKELIHPDDRENALKQLEQAFAEKGACYTLEHRLRHKNGSYRWILARGVVRRDANGDPVRMAGSHVDITERKEAAQKLGAINLRLKIREKALRRLVEWLKLRNVQLGEAQTRLIRAAKMEFAWILAAGVAHEIRNPLQILLGGLDHLDRRFQGVNDGVKEVMTDMRDAIRRADRIISRVKPHRTDPEGDMICRDVSLNPMIEEALKLARKELAESRIQVHQDLAPALPTVCADVDKIVEVLINLILNAVHAMPGGGTLTVRSRKVPRGGGSDQDLLREMAAFSDVVIAEVQDTGRGIDPADLPNIFKFFWRSDTSGKGMGLGLPIVKQLVDLHRGRIDIANNHGGGVIATLSLPVAAGTKSGCEPERRES